MVRNQKILFAMLFLAILQGCAKAPEKISPSSISSEVYGSRDCQGLITETERISTQLGVLAVRQKKAARVDVAALIIVGIPVTWMYKGDKGKEIAKLKGEILAVEAAASLIECVLPEHVGILIPTDEMKEEAENESEDEENISVDE